MELITKALQRDGSASLLEQTLVGKLGAALKAITDQQLASSDPDAPELAINRLTKLNLSGSRVFPPDLKALSFLLNQTGTLRSLLLARCNVGAAGMQELAPGIAPCRSLTVLRLTKCNLREDGAQALADSLGANQLLREVVLRDNRLGAAGIRHIAGAMCRNKILSRLDLSKNGFRDDGARALGECFRVNRALRRVDVRDNGIGPSGYRELSEGLTHNCRITQLDVTPNECGGDMLGTIQFICDRNSEFVRKMRRVVMWRLCFNSCRRAGLPLS